MLLIYLRYNINNCDELTCFKANSRVKLSETNEWDWHYSVKLSKSTCHTTRRVAIFGSDFLGNDMAKLYGSIYSLSIIDQIMGI